MHCCRNAQPYDSSAWRNSRVKGKGGSASNVVYMCLAYPYAEELLVRELENFVHFQ